MTTEAPLHRLWYDLRTQSLFEDSFRDDVLEIDRTLEDMIWRVVERYAAAVRRSPLLEPQAAYALFDGLFENALLGYLSGDARGPRHGSPSGCSGCCRRSARAAPLRCLTQCVACPRATRGILAAMTHQFLLLGQPR